MKDGRVTASDKTPNDMDTAQVPPRGRIPRRRTIDSDDAEPNDPTDFAPSKRGGPSVGEDMGVDDKLLNVINEVAVECDKAKVPFYSCVASLARTPSN